MQQCQYSPRGLERAKMQVYANPRTQAKQIAGPMTGAYDNRLLTTCAACAAPLYHDNKKRCSRCKTRYCSAICQQTHWERGGHDTLCKKIKKSGGAEQYHADQKYAEAVAEAAEVCAENTKGQTCYICAEAVHRHTKEGLVRGCACHTTEGYVHVSCLVDEAKTLVTEAQEKNLDDGSGWSRWRSCSLCGQNHRGAVFCALGWGAWKTYLDRPESDRSRARAALGLGNALLAVNRNDEALVVLEGAEATARRSGNSGHVFEVQPSCAQCYDELGMLELALGLRRDHYAKFGLALKIRHRREGEIDIATYPKAVHGGAVLLDVAQKLLLSLVRTERISEAKRFARRQIPVAQSVLGEDHEITLCLREAYAYSLTTGRHIPYGDAMEAWAIFEDIVPRSQRIFGDDHPHTIRFQAKRDNIAVAVTALLRETEAKQVAARNVILRFMRRCRCGSP